MCRLKALRAFAADSCYFLCKFFISDASSILPPRPGAARYSFFRRTGTNGTPSLGWSPCQPCQTDLQPWSSLCLPFNLSGTTGPSAPSQIKNSNLRGTIGNFPLPSSSPPPPENKSPGVALATGSLASIPVVDESRVLDQRCPRDWFDWCGPTPRQALWRHTTFSEKQSGARMQLRFCHPGGQSSARVSRRDLEGGRLGQLAAPVPQEF